MMAVLIAIDIPMHTYHFQWSYLLPIIYSAETLQPEIRAGINRSLSKWSLGGAIAPCRSNSIGFPSRPVLRVLRLCPICVPAVFNRNGSADYDSLKPPADRSFTQQISHCRCYICVKFSLRHLFSHHGRITGACIKFQRPPPLPTTTSFRSLLD
jgi:hypothetical protein